MKLIFIRHFSTAGNEKRQYIGRTDEAITEQARKIYLREPFHYPDVRQVVASPMRRCVQTAKLLYPMKKIWTQELLRECDFGEFEGRTYDELKEDFRYIQWMESGGTLPFPDGESQEEFCERCVAGFRKCIEHLQKEEGIVGEKACQAEATAAFVVHGGTIMAILSALDKKQRGFYEWQAANGQGFQAVLQEEKFEAGKRCLYEIEPLKQMYGV